MKNLFLGILCCMGVVGSALAVPGPVSTPWKPNERQNTRDMITCTGKYALCSQAVCTTSADGKRANCQCPVYKGRNLGGTACSARHGAVKNGDVYSDYSPIHLLGSKKTGPVASKTFNPGFVCNIPDGTSFSYADCMDIKCQDGGDGTASCNCPIYRHKMDSAYMMEASSCQKAEKMCDLFNTDENKLVINSAPTLFGASVIEASLQQFYGKHLTNSMICSLKDTKNT